jgi:hypothetical protein
MIDGKETVILIRGYEGQFLTDPAESFPRLGRNTREVWGIVVCNHEEDAPPWRGEGQ